MVENTVYSSEELRKVQLMELDALLELDRICGKLSIDYFLAGGTCLGAMRHAGFIPWDDDVDVGMLRENYQRFLREAPEHLAERYVLQTPYNELRNPYGYTKMRINGTQFVEYSNRNVRMHHGVYIDIFPFDEVTDDEQENIRQFRAFRRLAKLMYYRQTPSYEHKPEGLGQYVKASVLKMIHWGLKLTVPYRPLLRKMDQTAGMYAGSGQSGYSCLYFPKRMKMAVTKKELYPLGQVRFEGVSLKIMHDPDAYLTRQYGDWRQLPPEEERVGHKPYLMDVGE